MGEKFTTAGGVNVALPSELTVYVPVVVGTIGPEIVPPISASNSSDRMLPVGPAMPKLPSKDTRPIVAADFSGGLKGEGHE